MINNHARRETRYRVLNASSALTPLFGPWDRTVCFSDINKWLLCPGMYLMCKEGDAIYRRALSQEIGDIVHAETAKPVEDRLQDTAEIAAKLKNVRPEDRQAVALEVKKLIAKAVRVSDKESIDAIATEHESLMVWYDSYTNTFWYAKPDKMEVLHNERGSYLSVVDQKTGKWRKKTDQTCAFFFGYVAKMTRALDFVGPIRSMVRYLRDFQGNVLKTPDEREMWIGQLESKAAEHAARDPGNGQTHRPGLGSPELSSLPGRPLQGLPVSAQLPGKQRKVCRVATCRG